MTNDNAERDPAAAPAAPEPEPDPLALQAQRIQELEGEVARAKDQALRALAEAENVRRRTARELEDRSKFAVEGFARELLDVADNLRRALDAIAPEQRAQDALLEKLAAGVELT